MLLTKYLNFYINSFKTSILPERMVYAIETAVAQPETVDPSSENTAEKIGSEENAKKTTKETKKKGDKERKTAESNIDKLNTERQEQLVIRNKKHNEKLNKVSDYTERAELQVAESRRQRKTDENRKNKILEKAKKAAREGKDVDLATYEASNLPLYNHKERGQLIKDVNKAYKDEVGKKQVIKVVKKEKYAEVVLPLEITPQKEHELKQLLETYKGYKKGDYAKIWNPKVLKILEVDSNATKQEKEAAIKRFQHEHLGMSGDSIISDGKIGKTSLKAWARKYGEKTILARLNRKKPEAIKEQPSNTEVASNNSQFDNQETLRRINKIEAEYDKNNKNKNTKIS